MMGFSHRHCELSEAIQSSATQHWIAASPSASRNDEVESGQ